MIIGQAWIEQGSIAVGLCSTEEGLIKLKGETKKFQFQTQAKASGAQEGTAHILLHWSF